MANGRLKLLPSLLVFVVSIFVNAYFQITSFFAFVQWFLKTSSESNVHQQLAEILSRSDIPVGIRIAFGLLMTVFVMFFLLLAAYWNEKDKNIMHLFEQACSTMLIPMFLMSIAALLMNFSIVIGIVFGISASVSCMTVIIVSGKKANLNEPVLITIATAFFLITVVLLTRNHFVTMINTICIAR